jgi:ribosome biogenesis GTPase
VGVTAIEENNDSISENANSAEGTVFRVNSGNYFIQTQTHGVVVCKLRGNLKKELVYSTSGSRAKRVDTAKKRRATDPIAVGDRVRVNTELHIIEEILPRRSDLSRHSSAARGQHTLVANLDQLFVVFAAAEPRPDLWLLDRFLVLAESAELAINIIINKVDLVEGDDGDIRATMSIYEKIGYPIFYVSARQDIGVDAVREALRGKISAFAGPSGVGKSKLINAVCPGTNLKVGDIGYVTYKGRHTTTTAELIPIGEGHDSWVADTPGLRQLEFWDVDREDIVYCFPEFQPYLTECRFNDCRHRDEIGCAIQSAIESGEIDERRYRSFLEMTA